MSKLNIKDRYINILERIEYYYEWALKTTKSKERALFIVRNEFRDELFFHILYHKTDIQLIKKCMDFIDIEDYNLGEEFDKYDCPNCKGKDQNDYNYCRRCDIYISNGN